MAMELQQVQQAGHTVATIRIHPGRAPPPPELGRGWELRRAPDCKCLGSAAATAATAGGAHGGGHQALLLDEGQQRDGLPGEALAVHVQREGGWVEVQDGRLGGAEQALERLRQRMRGGCRQHTHQLRSTGPFSSCLAGWGSRMSGSGAPNRRWKASKMCADEVRSTKLSCAAQAPQQSQTRAEQASCPARLSGLPGGCCVSVTAHVQGQHRPPQDRLRLRLGTMRAQDRALLHALIWPLTAGAHLSQPPGIPRCTAEALHVRASHC